jgi:hypothetical protein
MLVSSGAAGVFPTSFGYYPVEGSRVVQAQYNWGSQAGFNEDLSQLVARGVETTIQSVYVDNSANPQAVTLMVSGTGQVVIVPANQQGIYPLFFTGAPSLMIFVPTVGAANSVTRCHYLNVPANTAGPWGGSLTAASLAYTTSSSGIAGVASGPLIAAGQFNRTVTMTTLPASVTNVWLNPTGGPAVIGTGHCVFAGGGSFTYGTLQYPMPTAAISAITDGGAAQSVAIAGG